MADDLLKIELGFQLIFQILLLLASWSLSSEMRWNAMALPIAMATCPAIWVSMVTSSSVKLPGRLLNTFSVPITPSRPINGIQQPDFNDC